jgi:hypothetical protein
VDAFIDIKEEILTIKEEFVIDNNRFFDIPELEMLLQQYNHEKSLTDHPKLEQITDLSLSNKRVSAHL